jgi:hypothetical protein
MGSTSRKGGTMSAGGAADDPRGGGQKGDRPEPGDQPGDHDGKSEERSRAEKKPRRPGLVIGPTTGDADVQLEW